MNLGGQNLLPVYNRAADIVQAVLNNAVVILTGETGSGKTTQLPQILADSPKIQHWADSKSPSIVCVQPHRVAAISVAKKVAEERGVTLGQEVGYVVRWDTMTDPDKTYIKYCTDGILLRECTEHEFSQYRVVIIDEAHERSINVDLLIALAKRVLSRKFAKRSTAEIPVRFVITSATLNVQKFKDFFPAAPTLHVEGRSFPVKIRHVPVTIKQRDHEHKSEVQFDTDNGGIQCFEPVVPQGKRRRKLPDWLSPSAAISASVMLACKIHQSTPISTGHILAFLSGAHECERAVKETQSSLSRMAEEGAVIAAAAVIPLYGTLDAQQQANVFVEVPSDCRKIIYATNVAETSLTIPGIGHVIDSGTVKHSHYHQVTGVSALERIPISKAQAHQRAGRAGRTRAGNCWRLYSEEMYDQMTDEPTPEILRSDPTSALLSLLAMRIKDVLHFEFLDAPDRTQLALGLRDLALLGAISPQRLELTQYGRAMNIIPVEPMFARCMIEAMAWDVVPEIAAIIALLSAGQIFITPRIDDLDPVEMDDDDASSAGSEDVVETPYSIFSSVLSAFRDPDSDHMTYLALFREFGLRTGREALNWAMDHSLSYKAMNIAARIHIQLLEAMVTVEERDQKAFEKRAGRGRLLSELERDVNKIKKRERILRALTSGLFLTAAKLSISRSGTIRGWSTARDGRLVRPASESVFGDFIYSANGRDAPPKRSDAPPWLICGNLQEQSSGRYIFRCASTVEYEWLKPLLERMRDITLADLLQDLEGEHVVDNDLYRDEEEVRRQEIRERQLDKIEAMRQRLKQQKASQS